MFTNKTCSTMLTRCNQSRRNTLLIIPPSVTLSLRPCIDKPYCLFVLLMKSYPRGLQPSHITRMGLMSVSPFIHIRATGKIIPGQCKTTNIYIWINKGNGQIQAMAEACWCIWFQFLWWITRTPPPHTNKSIRQLQLLELWSIFVLLRSIHN